jgi:hypothetical protein
MCRVEDLSADELPDYVRFFRSRATDDPGMRRLADWTERIN